VRVLSNPAYGGSITRVTELTARLRRFCASGFHAFWPDDMSIRDEATFHPELIAGHRQLTNIYLLGLAWRHEGTLATFDRRMSEKAIAGPAGSVLEVIAPADADSRR
jgi:hypothetical protein